MQYLYGHFYALNLMETTNNLKHYMLNDFFEQKASFGLIMDFYHNARIEKLKGDLPAQYQSIYDGRIRQSAVMTTDRASYILRLVKDESGVDVMGYLPVIVPKTKDGVVLDLINRLNIKYYSRNIDPSKPYDSVALCEDRIRYQGRYELMGGELNVKMGWALLDNVKDTLDEVFDIVMKVLYSGLQSPFGL